MVSLRAWLWNGRQASQSRINAGIYIRRRGAKAGHISLYGISSSHVMIFEGVLIVLLNAVSLHLGIQHGRDPIKTGEKR
jgi:hypothetical protein